MPQQEIETGDGETSGEVMRLQAFMSRCGAASRRASERFILEGRVRVNGTVVTALGSKVGPEDRVSLDGHDLHLEQTKRYLVLNKPRGYVSSMDDPEGRPIAAGLLRPYVLERVYNIGRLDQWSQGLLLFTNDGDFASVVGHPSSGVEKEYEVLCSMDIPSSFLDEFVSGVKVEGMRYRAEKARLLSARSARIVLVEGRNREIRRVFASRSIHVESLTRVRIGPVLLGGLAEGAFRDLTPGELEALRGGRRK